MVLFTLEKVITMLFIQQLKEKLNQLGLGITKHLNQDELQISIVPILRRLAAGHLHNNSFAVEPYFTDRKLNKTKSTDIEAKALAELLGCHLIITMINNKTRETNTQHVRQAEQTDAPIMHLSCRLDPWAYNSQDLDDHKDYLYIAMALALNNFAKNSQKKSLPENYAVDLEIKIIVEPNERLELYNRLPLSYVDS
jgi:hypothetical protein